MVFETNVDVAQLITFSEKMLAGARPYIDFIEVNPPASLLIYVPAIWLGRAFGINPEGAAEVLIFASIGVSLAMIAYIARSATDMSNKSMLLLLAGSVALLTVLPARIFGEREHLSVIASLPFIWAVAASFASKDIPAVVRAIAGLGAGLAIVIKPQFMLVLMPIAPLVVLYMRSLRVLLRVEWLALYAVCGLYWIVTLVYFPEYLSTVVPWLFFVYGPVRKSLNELVSMNGMAIVGMMLLAFALVSKGWRAKHLNSVLLSCCAGGVAAYLVQGKGWPYHSYPAVAFSGLAFLHQATSARSLVAWRVTIRFAALSIGLTIVGVCAVIWFNTERPLNLYKLAAVIERVHANPKMLMISGDISVGFPLVRMVNGDWVQRYASLFAVMGAQPRPGLDNANRVKLARLLDRQREELAEDIRLRVPDIILAETEPANWLEWARSSEVLARELSAYRTVAVVDHVTVLGRLVVPLR